MFYASNKNKDCCTDDAAAELAHKAGHKLREVIDMAGDEARDATAAAVKQVRSKPVQSGLIALGVGFLTGLLLRRR